MLGFAIAIFGCIIFPNHAQTPYRWASPGLTNLDEVSGKIMAFKRTTLTDAETAFFVFLNKTWFEAKKFCENQAYPGADLAWLHTQDRIDMLTQHNIYEGVFWISIRYQPGWGGIDPVWGDSDFPITNFKTNIHYSQPDQNYESTGSCMVVVNGKEWSAHWYNVKGTWWDEKCDKKHYFICSTPVGCMTKTVPTTDELRILPNMTKIPRIERGDSIQYECVVETSRIKESEKTNRCHGNLNRWGKKTPPRCIRGCDATKLPPTPTGLERTDDKPVYGHYDYANYRSASGYHCQGVTGNRCVDGAWSYSGEDFVKHLQCLKKCSDSDLRTEAATVTNSDYVTNYAYEVSTPGVGPMEGDTATFACIAGYYFGLDADGVEKPRTVQITCKEGAWTSLSGSSCVERPCPPPETKNTLVKIRLKAKPTERETFDVGETVKYVCPISYEIRGKQINTCVLGGQWELSLAKDNLPDCVLPRVQQFVKVLKLANVEHGYVFDDGQDREGRLRVGGSTYATLDSAFVIDNKLTSVCDDSVRIKPVLFKHHVEGKEVLKDGQSFAEHEEMAARESCAKIKDPPIYDEAEAAQAGVPPTPRSSPGGEDDAGDAAPAPADAP